MSLKMLIGVMMCLMTVEGVVVTYSDCSADSNAHWKDGACFCNDGFVAASYHGGHPCIKEELKTVYYCAIDKNAYWDAEKQECFCDEGFEPWRGNEGGHPCQEKDTYGIVARKSACDGDKNAGWDSDSLNCFCNEGYEPANGGAGGHPCRLARDL